jgi:high-affinity Fe2+/Pb2+ permease
MKLLAWLTETFIATFGITHPRPEQQRMANLLIGGLVLGVLIVVSGVIGFLIFAAVHR